MGHECRKARSQAEAVELLEAYAFDYILLDLEIPSRSEGDADIAYARISSENPTDARPQPHSGSRDDRSRIGKPSSLRRNDETRRH